MTVPTTLDELDRWRSESQLTEDLLGRVEGVERDILTRLECPTDPVVLFSLVKGEIAWPKKLSATQKRTALHAMNTLVFLAQARRALHLGAENPHEAARQALLAGLYAGHGALSIVRKQQSQAGGLARGQTRTENRDTDAKVEPHSKRWRASDELQDQYPSEATYVLVKTEKLGRRTIERSLNRLHPRQ